MNWEFCNNDESYEMLMRSEEGKIVASVFIDDDGVIAVSWNGERYLIEEFPKGTNLLEIEHHVKKDLGIINE